MRIADVLPLTPLQQGLLFHASTAQGSDDVVRGAAGHHLDRSAGSAPPARCGARGGHPASPPGGPILRAVRRAGADHPGRSRGAWQYVDLSDGDPDDVDEQIERVCAAERAAVCDLAGQPAFRAALIRTAADQHRFVLTNHHIVLDGWSMPILLREIFAGYYGQRLPAGRAVSQVRHLAGRSRPRCRPRGLG